MYKIVCKLEDIMIVLAIVLFFCLIGQEIERFWPDNGVIFAIFTICALVGGFCCAYRTIYDKGREAARKEQKPEEE